MARNDSTRATTPERVIIVGAAGRDFHIFNVCFRDDPNFQVVPFTAAQIPSIEGYSEAQLKDLAATIAAADCHIAMPVDLARLIQLAKPYCRVTCDLEEIDHPDLADVVVIFIHRHAGRIQHH